MILQKIKHDEDLIKLVGGVVLLDLVVPINGGFTIGSFKVTGTRENHLGRFIIGRDEEGQKHTINVNNIVGYKRR